MIENNKIVINTYAENLELYQAAYKKAFGIVDISPASGLGSDLAITAEMKKIADENTQFAMMQNSPYEATGRGLDNLCFLRGITRKIDEHSIALVTFSGADGIAIPKGSEVVHNVTGEIFTTNEQGVIASGSFSVFATAQNPGRVSCDVGTLTETAIADVTVTNSSPGELGYLSESDTDLRKRLFTYVNSLNVDEELYLNLLNLQDVKYANIVTNPELIDSPEGVPPKSTAVVVMGGDDKNIAKTIMQYYPADKKLFGDVSVTISTAINNREYIIDFSRPVISQVVVGVTITKDASFDVGSVGAITESILSFFADKFKIADGVIFDALYIPVMQDYNNGFSFFNGIVNVEISLNGDTVNLAGAYNKLYMLTADNLSVTVL